MPKAKDYTLDEQQLAEIETAIRRDKRPEVRQRCTAIHLLHLGHKPEAVAQMQVVSVPTIYDWIKRWQQEGIEGMANKPKPGRPRKTDDPYVQALEDTLAQEPKALGYDFAIWTVDRLRAHLEKQTGISLSEARLRALLKREGYRYRRPKHDLGHLQDKEAKAQAAALLDELKKRSPETILSSSLWMKPR